MAAVGVLSSWPAAAIRRSRLRRIVRSETSRIETTPPQVRSSAVSGSATASNQRRLPSSIVDRELDPEALTPRRPALRPILLAERHAGDVLEHDLLRRATEQAVVDDVGGDGLALVVDRDDRVADARQDRSQAVLLLLGLALLLLDGDRLDAQLLGPRGEVLVGDAQLLDGRRQLLVERLELLVGRLELLVEGLDLLAAGLSVLARTEHRRVGPAQVGDQRGQLVIGAQQALVDAPPPSRAAPESWRERRDRARCARRRPAR